MGCSGALGMRLAAQHADEWLPIDVAMAMHGGVAAAIRRFGDLVEASGRDRGAVPVTMFVWGWETGSPTRELLEGYCDIGIERLVLLPDTMAPHGRDETLRRLDEFQP